MRRLRGLGARARTSPSSPTTGLYALQHRGQEAAGIAVSDGRRTVVFKDLGLVSQVFDEQVLSSLRGHLAVGHVRYSTTGSTTWENAQPTFRTTATGSGIALGHNGNLVNTAELRDEVAALRTPRPRRRDARPAPTRTWSASCCRHRRRTSGSRRPRCGCCPGCAGRSRWSSRTSRPSTRPATRTASARWCSAASSAAGWWRARRPRWTSSARPSSARSSRASCSPSTPTACAARTSPPAEPKGCVFEYVYLARPDTTISGRSVHAARVEIGRRLAQEPPVEADLVIPMPESGTPAAIGYAQGSGIPYGQGLVKNAYVGRTFIQPSQTIRQLGIRLKLNPLRDVIRGKRLVVVDDSIVRGNTQRALVRMLREAGALEVHVRIASPPGALAVLLRHRLRHPRRAGGQRAGRRGRAPLDRRRHPRLRLARGPDRRQRAAAQPAVHGLLRRRLPDPLPEEARLGKHLLEDLVRAPERTPAVDVSGSRRPATRRPVGPPADRCP